MRRLILFGGFLALVGAACGDDGTGPTITAPVQTTAAGASTTAVTTTTIDPAASRIALALIFSGEWEGEWVNTTRGTTGPVAVAIAVDTGRRTATLTIDLGGSVFGAGDPEAFVFVADLTAVPPFLAVTPLLGEATFDVEATGRFTLEARDVPGAGLASFAAGGTATSAGIELAYTVGFDNGGSAAGTANLRRPTQ